MRKISRNQNLLAVVGCLCAAQISCSQVQRSAVPEAAATIREPTEIVSTLPASPTPVAATSPAATMEPANGEAARRFLEKMVNEIGPRLTGSDADKRAADSVQSALEAMGYDVERQAFSIMVDEVGEIDSANILAVKEGKSDREIVVGAHYDSGDEGAGADDNASGVAVLLETAQRIRDLETPYTVRFIAFGAEETGLDGSAYYVNNLKPGGLEKIAYMINMDSLIAGEIAYIYGDADFSGNLRDWMLEDARRKGFEAEGKTAAELDPPDAPCECSDFFSFKEAGIPYVYFEATNWNLGDRDGWTQVNEDFGDNGMIWHTPYDTVEYIEQIAPGRIDEHLELYVTILADALTEYQLIK